MNGSEEARRRAETYRLLSFGFHYPPREEDLALMESLAGEHPESLSRGLSELFRLARETPEALLKQDFHDLFMAPVPKYTAPYESVYVDAPIEAGGRAAPRTYGPSTQAVMAFYERIGLDISREYIELPDHVGLELACMEYLCRREAEYLEAGSEEPARKSRDLQQRFLKEHLSRWFPGLEAAIRRKAETEYYRGLAALALAWLREEVACPCPGAPKCERSEP